MSEKLISIILPVYHEAENIARCLHGLWQTLKDQPHEILVCYHYDDDPTLEAYAAISDKPPSVVLVKNTYGPGPANSIRTGFSAARGDVIVTFMADLSDPPAVIPEMTAKIREGADVVSGSRYMSGGSHFGGPLLKNFLSRAAGLSLYYVAGVGTHDSTNNFRAYSRRFLDQVLVESQTGFQIALELTVKAHLKGFQVSETPSSWRDRSAGESGFRLLQWLPYYFHWYWRAMAVPLLIWAELIFFTLLGVLRFARKPAVDEIDFGYLLILALASFFYCRLAFRERRRLIWSDTLVPGALLLAWHIFFTRPAALRILVRLASIVGVIGVGALYALRNRPLVKKILRL